jgi:hypothetical protein
MTPQPAATPLSPLSTQWRRSSVDHGVGAAQRQWHWQWRHSGGNTAAGVAQQRGVAAQRSRLQIAAYAGIRMRTRCAPLLPPHRIRRDDASAYAYDVASSLSCDDNDDDNDDRGGSIIPTDNSDAITRGYGNCRKAVAGEIALAGAADVPVAEEWEEAMARNGVI